LPRHNGFAVEIAGNGEAPIRRAQTRPKPQARVVIMTGLDDWVADNAADLGAEGLLRKPFCPQALLDGPGIAAAVICGVGCRKSVAATALDLCQ
jgi:CheY-like chemotaxis protein